MLKQWVNAMREGWDGAAPRWYNDGHSRLPVSIMSAPPYKQLEQEFKRLHAFRGAISLLNWDASVMMPRGSAELRGEQLAALETEYHTLLTAPKITRLLDRAHANTQTPDSW